MSCLHLHDLTISFATAAGAVQAVKHVTIDHVGGEILALMGETGCGKSVIAASIVRLLPPTATVRGRIMLDDRDLLTLKEREMAAIRGTEIGIVLQNPSLALNPIHRLGRQIAEPLRARRGRSRRAAWHDAMQALERLGFSDVAARVREYPFQFSGGMNQRALMAAATILHPRVLIADEPTKGLDPGLRGIVAEELLTIKGADGSAVLLITHDFSLARRVADRLAIMYGGEILEIAPAADFFAGPLHPYSHALLRSLPESGFHPIPGAPPSMIDPPRGCCFGPRCPHVRPECAAAVPPLVTTGDRSVRCLLYA